MVDPVIRPGNGLMLIALQTVEGAPASPSPTTNVVAVETDSVSYNGPYKSEQTNEATGSFAAGSPLVVGQPGTISFRARLRGSNGNYSSSNRPPLHAALSACGWLGQFTPAISASALSAGTSLSATLGTGFGTDIHMFRGMQLLIGGSNNVGRYPLITAYSTAKVATLSERFNPILSSTNTAALLANWSYAPTSPLDAASRVAMHPAATIQWIEDGSQHTWTDCRGTVDFDGSTARPGFGMFSFTGVYQGRTDVTMPSAPTFAGQSAPTLVQGVSLSPAFAVKRNGLAISQWSIKNGGQIGTPEDPNTPIGFGSGQIAERAYTLEIDPLVTQVAVRDALADIAAFAQYPAALQFGATVGNMVGLVMPLVQPIETSPGLRERLRSETLRYQAIAAVRDIAGRDGDIILSFS